MNPILRLVRNCLDAQYWREKFEVADEAATALGREVDRLRRADDRADSLLARLQLRAAENARLADEADYLEEKCSEYLDALEQYDLVLRGREVLCDGCPYEKAGFCPQVRCQHAWNSACDYPRPGFCCVEVCGLEREKTS